MLIQITSMNVILLNYNQCDKFSLTNNIHMTLMHPRIYKI